MSWYSFRPYVSVAERRRQAAKTAQKMAKGGRSLAPVQPAGRAIATTFWGKSWCDNLESYSDYENRLPRGRSYVRNGSVIDLQIAAGKITALVQGSSLYKIGIEISALPKKPWAEFTSRCAGKVTNLLDLLQGRLSKEILQEISTPGRGLFPAPKEIKLSCSCPDWADMCKHVAAVLYGVGVRLDEKPELFFTLRGVDVQDLITSASVSATTSLTGAPADTAIADADLGALFGVELETASAAPAPASASPPPTTKATGKTPVKRAVKSPVRPVSKSPAKAPAKSPAKSPVPGKSVADAKPAVVMKKQPASKAGSKKSKTGQT
ncbi:hypothetical protein LBMAG56_38820 [Verrucomicrobiota bacterium]|nr:hypothetical protein LBMAG56_38820 [Verrucomicrobiota bacterium]